MLAFSAVGAPLTGMSRDWTGSFVYAWIAGTALLVAAFFLLLTTPRPQRRPQPAEPEPAATFVS
jgi:hypothetical protein